MPIWRRIALMSTSGARTSTPSKTIAPALGSSSRFRQRSSVLLPEPDGPMMNTSSCGATRRSIPRSTWSGPKCLCSPATSRIGGRRLTPAGSLARRRVRLRDVALEARLPPAGEDGDRRGARLGLDPEPLLAEAREDAVELHALDDRLDLVAHRHVVPAERDHPHQAGLDRVRELERGGLLDGPGLHGVARQVGEGTAGEHRLDGVGLGAVVLHGEAVLLRVVAPPRVVDRAAVDGDRLALEVLEPHDVGRVLLEAELVVRVQVALGEEQGLRPPRARATL